MGRAQGDIPPTTLLGAGGTGRLGSVITQWMQVHGTGRCPRPALGAAGGVVALGIAVGISKRRDITHFFAAMDAQAAREWIDRLGCKSTALAAVPYQSMA